MWADYPFPLISTPAVEVGYTDQFVRSASKMALTHNIMIRGMNSIYLQCEYVTPENAHDFVTYCQCWSEFIHNHHRCEEAAYFPVIEKECGMEGIAETNVEQHEAFMSGLHKFDQYVYHIDPYIFSGHRLVEILDSFAATLQMHLTDEVVWILSLSRFPQLNLARIDMEYGLYVKARSTKTRLLPFLLSNHDLTYENDIHRWWPTNGALRDFFLRYICSVVHFGAWRYSCCTLSGRPKPLVDGVDWNRLKEVAVDSDLELNPRKPEKAYMPAGPGSDSRPSIPQKPTKS